MIGYSSEQFNQEVIAALENFMNYRDGLNSDFYTIYSTPYSSNQFANPVSHECDTPYEEMLLDNNINEAIPFVSERGYLCFVYDINQIADVMEYGVCIDLVTNDYIYQIYDQPMLFYWESTTN